LPDKHTDDVIGEKDDIETVKKENHEEKRRELQSVCTNCFYEYYIGAVVRRAYPASTYSG